jgi:hypothetical protein
MEKCYYELFVRVSFLRVYLEQSSVNIKNVIVAARFLKGFHMCMLLT